MRLRHRYELPVRFIFRHRATRLLLRRHPLQRGKPSEKMCRQHCRIPDAAEAVHTMRKAINQLRMMYNTLHPQQAHSS